MKFVQNKKQKLIDGFIIDIFKAAKLVTITHDLAPTIYK